MTGVQTCALPIWAEHVLPREGRAEVTILDSYHCSRYNTNTRRLTPEKFEVVFARARELVDA